MPSCLCFTRVLRAFNFYAMGIDQMLVSNWTAVHAADGRCYYWDTATDEVSWTAKMTEKQIEQIRLANETVDDLRQIATNARLQTALRIGMSCRLQRIFDSWRMKSQRPSRVDVRAISFAIECQLTQQRQFEATRSALVDDIRCAEHARMDADARVADLLEMTLHAKVDFANSEFMRLNSRARHVLR